MSAKFFLTLLTLVAVLSLVNCGCSGISYAAAPADLPAITIQEATSQPTPPSTVKPTAAVSAKTLTVTIEELTGTWFNGSYITFKTNGVYVVYASLEAQQLDVRLDDGTYGVMGNQLWFGPMSSHCNGMGFYQLTGKSQNELEFVKIREECSRSLDKLLRVTP